jgi:hypothetical protein
MNKQAITSRSREEEEELAALWGSTPDVSMIFETTETPKPKKFRSSALDDIFAAYFDTKVKERSPVKTSFDSLDKAMAALKRKLNDPPPPGALTKFRKPGRPLKR